MTDIIREYADLLRKVDNWFDRCITAFPGDIACKAGCSECCRGLFDITLLDAFHLNHGFLGLNTNLQKTLRDKAHHRLAQLREKWPDLSAPFILNHRPEEEWEELMPDDDETPCLLLDGSGNCILYDFRPMTCRLHGIPHVDLSGEVLFDEWCSLNFNNVDPLAASELRTGFTGLFREEIILFRRFTAQLLRQEVNELDTFIPLSLMIDFKRFDWIAWFSDAKIITNPAVGDQ